MNTTAVRMDGAIGQDRNRLLETLRSNQGFLHPEQWVDYARRHGFRLVPAHRIETCPDCGAVDSTKLGQYVYYSTLCALRECGRCGLIYSDTRLDAEIVRTHFELAYKDEAYFSLRRNRVFEQLAALVDRYAPADARVLDVGGAIGHLMARVAQRRADVKVTVNDLSTTACRVAAESHGFHTIHGSVTALEKAAIAFDVVVMSDVIYYEPELCRLWRLLPRLVMPGGVVIIRVPNRLVFIRLSELVMRLLGSRWQRARRDRVRFFNPEHLYVFSRRYLLTRLRLLGFDQIVVAPAELLVGCRWSSYINAASGTLAKAVRFLTRGKVILTPAMIVIARRGCSDRVA